MTDYLTDLSRAYVTYQNLRATIDAEMLAEKSRRLAEARVAPAMLAAQARESGVSIQKIAKLGLGTTARETAYRLIEEGKRYLHPTGTVAQPTDVARAQSEFAWADVARTEFTATPTAPDLEKILAHLDIASEELDATPSLAVATFRLARTPGGTAFVEAVTPGFSADSGRHPVVALMQMDAAYAARAMEWAQEA